MAYIPCRIGGGAIINIPNGKTVTPTDDIQTWLHCAGIFDNNYTTLAQILADTSVFTTLLADSNACDYMARSTTWALAEGAVPTMTSNTTPSGECSAQSIYGDTYKEYFAFDRNADGNGWIPLGTATVNNTWLQYEFPTAKIINAIQMYQRVNGNIPTYSKTTVFKLLGSNTGNDFTEIASGLTLTGWNTFVYTTFNNTVAYKYYRIVPTDVSATQSNVGLTTANGYKFQFYEADITRNQDAMALIGKYDYCSNELLSNATWASAIANSDYFESILNVKVPVMTGYTTPEGRVITDSEFDASSTMAWKAFDNNTNTAWESQQGATQAYCGYIFTSPVAIKKVAILGNDPSSYYTHSLKDFNIEWSDDESTWTTDSTNFTYTVNQGSSALHNFYSPTLSGSYKGWRINAHNTWGANYLTVRTIQFYGRQEPKAGVIHCATNDVITITGNGVTKTVYADGNEGVLPLDLKSGLYTFTSSIAKNPANLSENYSKNILITDYTTDVYLMPDPVKTLYWWGYVGSNLEDVSSVNGWTFSYTMQTPTHNANEIDLSTSSGSVTKGIGSKESINANKIHGIVQSTGTSGNISLRSSKNFTTATSSLVTSLTTGLNHIQSTEQSSSGYMLLWGTDSQTLKCKALWYE